MSVKTMMRLDYSHKKLRHAIINKRWDRREKFKAHLQNTIHIQEKVALKLESSTEKRCSESYHVPQISLEFAM